MNEIQTGWVLNELAPTGYYAKLPEYSDILTLSLNLVYVSQQGHFWGVFS